MKNKDTKSIYESYTEDVLKNKNDSDTEDENTEKKPTKKKVVLKSEELSVNVGPKIRAVLRNFPTMVEENDVLSELKKAIERANSELSSDEEITQSPLKVYDKLIEIKALSEEDMDEEEFEERETEVLQNFNDDDYTEDDDAHSADIRKDIEKGKAEEIIRRMGTDWRKDDEDFYSSNY